MKRLTRVAYIYALVDSATKEVRYVGQTVCPRKRLGSHCSQARRGDLTYRSKWLRAINYAADLIVLKVCALKRMPEFERDYIAYYRALGSQLTNLTDGGEGVSGYHRSAETRAKQSASTKGKPKVGLTIEGRERLRAFGRQSLIAKHPNLDAKLDGIKVMWDTIPPEERSARATARNLEAWAKRDSEDRKALGQNIREGILAKSTPEIRHERAMTGADWWEKATPEMKEAHSARMRAFWEKMGPEGKAAELARRRAVRKAREEREFAQTLEALLGAA